MQHKGTLILCELGKWESKRIALNFFDLSSVDPSSFFFSGFVSAELKAPVVSCLPGVLQNPQEQQYTCTSIHRHTIYLLERRRKVCVTTVPSADKQMHKDHTYTHAQILKALLKLMKVYTIDK